MADQTSNLYRVYVCSGRLRAGQLVNDFSQDVIGCRAQLLTTNPLAWRVTYQPQPVPINDFDDLEIYLSSDGGDFSATGVSACMAPSNTTSTSFVVSFYSSVGVPLTTAAAGCYFNVWRRPKQ